MCPAGQEGVTAKCFEVIIDPLMVVNFLRKFGLSGRLP